MSSTRSALRTRLNALLQSALVGTGLPVQAVYAYRVGDFRGQSPVIAVTSAGSERPRMTSEGDRGTFALDIHVFVRYADSANGWTEEDAEESGDDIESRIAAVVARSQEIGTWNTIRYRGQSETRVWPGPGGVAYRYERIPIAIEVYA